MSMVRKLSGVNMKTDEQTTLDRLHELEQFKAEIEAQNVPELFGVRLDMVGEIHDPYAINSNAMSFKAHPDGFMLRWCREESRNSRGWKGWEPVTWDEEIGKNLNKYANDPPAKLHNNIDNKVRRGDALLCKLPVGVFVARKLAQLRKSSRVMQEQMTPAEEVVEKYRPGAYGGGIAKSERPQEGFKMRKTQVSERSEHAKAILSRTKAVSNNPGDDNAED